MYLRGHLTDSVFFPALPLIEKKYSTIDINDTKKMVETIREVTNQVQSFLNATFDVFSDKFLNITEGHKFFIKQEIIGRSGMWLNSKKRYAIWIIDDKGVKKDKIKPVGLDVVRSSFPNAFKTFLSTLLSDILKNVSKDEIDDKIIKFNDTIKRLPIEEIAQPTSVKNITKYGTKRQDKSKIFGNWIKRTPAHVKASISYNEFLEYHNLDKKFAKLSNGDKIKWVYLKKNPFGIDGFAFKGYDDPVEVIQFINQYIDRNKIYEHIFAKKMRDFYEALKWDIPSAQQKLIDELFEF